MQRIWQFNSTLFAKVHLMNFGLYNFQMPQSPDCRTSRKCSGDIGLSENNSAENSPWGEGAIASSKSNRITYKLCLIMHLVHTKRALQYLSDSVRTVARSSSRPGLRSSNTAVYAKPRCETKFGERGFSHAGPTAWNSLPHHLHQISDTGLFKHRLKTELFRRAYVASC